MRHIPPPSGTQVPVSVRPPLRMTVAPAAAFHVIEKAAAPESCGPSSSGAEIRYVPAANRTSTASVSPAAMSDRTRVCAPCGVATGCAAVPG